MDQRMEVETVMRRHHRKGFAEGVAGKVMAKKVLERQMAIVFYWNGCRNGRDWMDQRKKVVTWKVSWIVERI